MPSIFDHTDAAVVGTTSLEVQGDVRPDVGGLTVVGAVHAVAAEMS